MTRRLEIDVRGKPGVVVTIRFAREIIEMLDIISNNRSKFVRDATWEKINREMEKNNAQRQRD